MKPLKNFEEYLKEGIARKQFIDKSRAESLLKDSQKDYKSLKKIINSVKIEEEDANTILKLSYDVIMELIRAIMLMKGFSASGQGAHEAEVVYLREINISENEVQFLDSLRYFRNKITYYGYEAELEYALETIKFLEKIYPKLLIVFKKN